MTEIDRPFKISGQFAVVWGCFATAVGFLAFRYYDGAAYEKFAVTIIGSLYATFCLYGPILLARLVVRSGGRGWFVLQIAVSVVLGAGLIFAGVAFANHGEVSGGVVFLLTLFIFLNLHEWLGNGSRT